MKLLLTIVLSLTMQHALAWNKCNHGCTDIDTKTKCDDSSCSSNGVPIACAWTAGSCRVGGVGGDFKH